MLSMNIEDLARSATDLAKALTLLAKNEDKRRQEKHEFQSRNGYKS